MNADDIKFVLGELKRSEYVERCAYDHITPELSRLRRLIATWEKRLKEAVDAEGRLV